MNNLVSIILPSYNHDKYIRETISSLINLTHINCELIVVDDGSNDNSIKIIREMEARCLKRFHRFILINQVNQGVGIALNKGIEISNGEYIFIISSDDKVYPHALEKLLAPMIDDDTVGLAVGNAEYIDSESRAIHCEKNGKRFTKFLDYHLEDRVNQDQIKDSLFGSYSSLLCGNYIPPGQLLRKKYFIESGMFSKQHIEDWGAWLSLSKISKFLLCNEILVSYRLHDKNAHKTISNSNSMFFSFLQLIVNEHSYAFNNGFYAEWREVYIKYTSIMQSKLGITSSDLRFTPLALELSGEIRALKLQNKELEILNGDLALQLKNYLATNNQVLNKLPSQIKRSFWFYPPGVFYDFLVGSVSVRGGILPLINRALCVYKEVGFSGVLRKLKQLLKSQKLLRSERGYSSWMGIYGDLLNPDDSLLEYINFFEGSPKISILMPVYDPPIEYLDRAILSVRGQLYQNWQLCIVDDGSKSDLVRQVINKHAQEDSRITILMSKVNQHISSASNAALELANGDFVALLDHDDELSIDALFWIAYEVIKFPSAGLIYSDEDKIDMRGIRYDPYFKPNFDRQLLLAQNYICHLTVLKRDIIHQAGGFRVGYEGAQDYDLVLRASELLTQDEIRHIPRILYHWRAIQGSTALSTSEKNYAVIAGRKAVEDYLKRNGVGGTVEPVVGAPFYNRIKFDLPKESPLISIIIPTRDNVKVLSKCIDTILGLTAYKNYEIIILDNQSEGNETLQYFEKISNETVKVIRADFPFNYSRLNNLGTAVANGEYLCFLNDDIEVINNEWLSELISHAQNPQVGCVGAKLYYPSGLIQHAGVVLGIGGVAGHVYKGMSKSYPGYFGRALLQQSKSAVTAACLMVKKSIYEEVGGFDEKLAVAFNDIDFCIKVKSKGYTNIWTPFAELIHHESLTRGYEDTPEKKLRFQKEVLLMKERWGDELANDEFYNLNLTLEFEDFSLAFPPRLFERPSL